MTTRHSNGTRSANNNGHVPAVAYLRASSDKQETSVPDQRKAVTKYAESHGYHLTGEYVDDGISGDATEKRIGFQRMISDAGRGLFSAIIVWDQDRFGRFDSVEAGFWIHPLRLAGVQLVTVAEGAIDWNGFTGRLMYSIKQEGKHQFLRDLSRNVMRGRLSAAKRGEWLGRVPYGYRKRHKRLVLGPASEVATASRIFDDYAAGKSIRSICGELNIEAIPSPGGSVWHPTAVQRHLTNDAYCGVFSWNRNRCGKYNGCTKDEIVTALPAGANDESDWIVFNDHHPAIVTVETFEQVQRQLRRRQKITTPVRHGGEYLLSGLIRCGKCGGAMSGQARRNKRYYVCGKPGICDRNAVNQTVLLETMLPAIQKLCFKGDTIERIKSALHDQLGASEADPEAIRGELQTLAAKIVKAERRLVQCDDDLLDAVQRQLRSLRQERDRLQALLAAAEAAPADIEAESRRR